MPPETVIAQKHPGGRPPKYQDRADFLHCLRIAIRVHYYMRHKAPSIAGVSHALSIEKNTLKNTLARFGLSLADWRMIGGIDAID